MPLKTQTFNELAKELVKRLERLHKKHKSEKPMVIGIAGLQGCGKTTLTSIIGEQLYLKRFSCVSFSLDDFYLTRDELREKQSNTPKMKHRGVPGTHDIKLLDSAIRELKSNSIFKIPIYDKSLFNGDGDRSGFKEAKANDFILMEGWFLGVAGSDLSSKTKELELSKKELRLYESTWKEVDAWIYLDCDEAFSMKGRKKAEGALSQLNVEDFLKYMWEWVSPVDLKNSLLKRENCMIIKVFEDHTASFEN